MRHIVLSFYRKLKYNERKKNWPQSHNQCVIETEFKPKYLDSRMS